eukprot:TRINITY_DN7425_c0_g1_i4.p1 TRINITY_DN7425_c0_g1~~TRINITY_DN7425_c0_g1_i4.p1  ORF type:complete len:121 (-),score=2.59 TRINITY_DN7425_c0_g1_i4:157-519(-)
MFEDFKTKPIQNNRCNCDRYEQRYEQAIIFIFLYCQNNRVPGPGKQLQYHKRGYFINAPNEQKQHEQNTEKKQHLKRLYSVTNSFHQYMLSKLLKSNSTDSLSFSSNKSCKECVEATLRQ